MFTMKTLSIGLLTVTMLVLGMAGFAFAGAVINSGDIFLGVNDEGHLNVVDPTGTYLSANGGVAGAIGIAKMFADGSIRDATSPGCLCEGWGVSASGSTMFANISTDFGPNNITVTSFTANVSSITSVVSMTSLPGLSVSQAYSAAPEAPTKLFQNVVTITNNTGSALTDVRYVRVMDWDVPPTEFSDVVTIKGTGTTTLLELSHDNGFDTANPLSGFGALDPATINADFTDHAASDNGAYFKFNFGSLADGDSYTFTIYYGAAGTETEMLAALSAVGIELFSLGQSSTQDGPTLGTPATYAFGFKGVGGTPIIPAPEPSTLILLGSGLAGLAGLSSYRKGKKL